MNIHSIDHVTVGIFGAGEWTVVCTCGWTAPCDATTDNARHVHRQHRIEQRRDTIDPFWVHPDRPVIDILSPLLGDTA